MVQMLVNIRIGEKLNWYRWSFNRYRTMAKILIVEDEKQMAEFINLELNHEGYEVDVCYDGEQGYQKAIETD
mgnify:CR=1 FL=1